MRNQNYLTDNKQNIEKLTRLQESNFRNFPVEFLRDKIRIN